MTKALLLISDLVSRQHAKEIVNKESVYIKNIEALKENLEQSEDIEIYLDLTNNRLDLSKTLELINKYNMADKTICFFPHIRSELAEIAQKAGFQNVMPRSKFFR